jgi:Glycosyltransferase family 28 C-terminal domain
MSLKILVAPLCWGLGHATRCIPLIKKWIAEGHCVTLASDGDALLLLRKEFPALPFIVLPSYNVRYDSANMMRTIVLQLPKITIAVVKEHFALRKYLKANHTDLVVSDNRFGLFVVRCSLFVVRILRKASLEAKTSCATKDQRAKTIFITHQVNIQIPNKLIQKIVNAINHWFIRRYDECWILDDAPPNNLAGKLSAPIPPSFKNATYIGTLSRFEFRQTAIQYDITAVLSGPEPQRTVFESEILAIFQQQPPHMRLLIVRGVVTLMNSKTTLANISYVDYLTSHELNEVFLASKRIICRSGYSTIMDLIATHHIDAILVPTPGQTEQEYLADSLHKQNKFKSLLVFKD